MTNDEATNHYYFPVKNLSELNSLEWLRWKKETIISGNNDFRSALNDALNYQNIETHPERISKLKAYINKYNWEGIDFPAGSKDWIKFEKKLPLIYYLYHTIQKTISLAYISEYNNKRRKQVILLMITNGKKSHYLAVTNFSALFQGMSSNYDGDFYCLNCFNSYTTKNKFKEHEEICNNHDSYHIEMTKCSEKMLKHNPGEKSLKVPFAIYLDLECLLKKKSCQNNPEKSYTEKKTRHEPSGWAMFTRCSFNEKENKLND